MGIRNESKPSFGSRKPPRKEGEKWLTAGIVVWSINLLLIGSCSIGMTLKVLKFVKVGPSLQKPS